VTYRERQRLSDIVAAIETIGEHLRRDTDTGTDHD
jgi:hypothetical protein